MTTGRASHPISPIPYPCRHGTGNCHPLPEAQSRYLCTRAHEALCSTGRPASNPHDNDRPLPRPHIRPGTGSATLCSTQVQHNAHVCRCTCVCILLMQIRARPDCAVGTGRGEGGAFVACRLSDVGMCICHTICRLGMGDGRWDGRICYQSLDFPCFSSCMDATSRSLGTVCNVDACLPGL